MDPDNDRHASAEEIIRDLRLQLRERVKELACLHRIAELIDSSTTLPEVLQGTVELLPSAWQHADIACARILHRGQEFRTPNFRATPWMQTCDLHVFRRAEGCVQVGYLTELAPGTPAVFLEEEDALLRTIANRLETVIERFRASDALKQGFRFANSALDALFDHVAVLDESGTILFVNEMWRRFAEANHPVPETVCEGANYLEVCTRVVGADAEMARSFASGILAVARSAQDAFSLEYPSHTASEQRWYSGTVTRFVDNGSIRIVVAHQDITPRKSAEQALRASESKFRSVVQQSNDGIALTDASGKVIEWNRGMEMITQLSRDQVVGRPLWDVQFDMAPDELKTRAAYERLQGRLEQFFRSLPMPWRGPVQDREIQHPDGTRAVVQTSLFSIEAEGTHLAGAIVRDVTQRLAAEESLRKLSSAVEQSPIMLAITDTALVVEYVNPRFTEVTGYAPEEVVGEKLDHKRSLLNADSFLKIITQALREGEDWRGEILNYKKNGEPYWERLSVTPIKDHFGQTTHYLQVSQDITVSKRAEAAREESETKLRAIFESSRDAIGVSRAGVHVIVNPAYVTMFGYASADELTGVPIINLIGPSERSRIVDHVRRRAAGEPVPSAYETRGLRKDGSEFDMGVRASTYNLHGEHFTLVILRDITERKRAEQALRKAKEEAETARAREEQRYQEAERRREIAEGLGDVVAALNSDQPLSRILDMILRQAHKLLGNQASAIYSLLDDGGYTLDAAEGLTEMGVAEPDLACGQKALRQAIDKRQAVVVDDTGTFAQGECKATADGNLAPHAFQSLLAVPILVQGMTYGGLVLFYATPHRFRADEVELVLILNHQVALAIENARLHQEAERAAVTAERTRLARDLHDAVTQTLFSASITAEALPRIWEEDPEEARRGLAELQQLTRGALAEMRTLLLELRPAGIAEKPLGVILQQLVDAVSSRTRLPITLAVEGDQCLSPEAQTAFYRIAQEALNNVAKHAHATQVQLRLACEGGEVVLEVKDNGQGFDTNKRIPGKHGMGTMYERAAGIGAVLEVASAPGRGTRISIRRQLPEQEQR